MGNSPLRQIVLFCALAFLAAALPAACGSKAPSCAKEPCILAGDGLVLRGKTLGDGSPGIILVHDFNSSQAAWESLAATLSARGYRVLTFDLRGHGKSPGNKDITLSDSDLSAALKYMGDVLDRPSTFLIGAGSGGTAALKVAARDKVKGVVTISAPESFLGFSANESLGSITAPKLFIASSDEARAQDARNLMERAREPKRLELVPGNGTGTAIFAGSGGDRARTAIITFLEANKN